MKDKLIRQAKKDYEKLPKEIKEVGTVENYIKLVLKKYNEGYDQGFKNGNKKLFKKEYKIKGE